ncbi:MAG TPA: ABC transporter substrate-binding protein [Candidatus Tetragenococcus pullicola]|nr:ABC transporter substrate-binding protein [Candidatus Tetragenococcus pullicola]
MTKKIIAGFVSCLSLLSLAACGQSTTDEKTNESTAPTEVQKEQTLTDAQGHEVTIPANPKRIIGSYLEDYLVALDEIPVAQWTVGKGSVQKYLQEDLKDIPTINYDLPYEDVLSFEPDLLLIESDSAVEGGKYAEYEKIAPTYVVKNGTDISWQERLEDIAKVLHKEDQAKQVEADYQQLIEETKESEEEKIAGKSAAVIWVTNNSAFMVAGNRSSGKLIYDELGFEMPELTKQISEDATADFSQVSLESLSQLDADYLILVNSDEKAEMFSDPLWENIPAVKNDQVFEYGPDKSWLYNGPIAYTKMLEDIKESLQ